MYAASEQNRNIFTMGLSSGKIAHYLQCGLPVVTTGFPTVRRYVEGYHCGRCVDHVEEVSDALKTILMRYTEYSENALACFRAEFDLDTYLMAILHRFDRLIA